MKILHTLSMFASLLLAQACTPGGAPNTGGSGVDGGGNEAAQAELGTGVEGFEPLGADIVAIAGPQGGHHFFVHARIAGLVPGDPERPGLLDNPRTRFAAYLVVGDDEQQLDLEYPPDQLGYVDDGAGFYELPSGRLLILNETMLPSAYDQQIRITVEVTDSDGAVAFDERTVVARVDPLE